MTPCLNWDDSLIAKECARPFILGGTRVKGAGRTQFPTVV
jgi:hypothetical protein